MSSYTLSCSLLNGVLDHKPYVSKILFHFICENPYKVVLDKSNKILALYEDAAKNDKSNIIYAWIDLMAKKAPVNFEYINVNLEEINSNEEIFLKVCSHTKNQKKLIIYSHQEWENFEYCDENLISYNSIDIEIYDRDEAVSELHPVNVGDTYQVQGSNFANRGGSISNSKIE